MDEIEPANEMYDCPYAKGLQCNQRKNLCDQARFEPHCLMSILRCIDVAVESKNEGWINEGIERACHILLHKGFIKKAFDGYSTSKLTEDVQTIIKEAKKSGREWYDIGFEFWTMDTDKNQG